MKYLFSCLAFSWGLLFSFAYEGIKTEKPNESTLTKTSIENLSDSVHITALKAKELADKEVNSKFGKTDLIAVLGYEFNLRKAYNDDKLYYSTKKWLLIYKSKENTLITATVGRDSRDIAIVETRGKEEFDYPYINIERRVRVREYPGEDIPVNEVLDILGRIWRIEPYGFASLDFYSRITDWSRKLAETPPIRNWIIDSDEAMEIAITESGYVGSAGGLYSGGGGALILNMRNADGQFVPMWITPIKHIDVIRGIRADNGKFVYLKSTAGPDSTGPDSTFWTSIKPVTKFSEAEPVSKIRQLVIEHHETWLCNVTVHSLPTGASVYLEEIPPNMELTSKGESKLIGKTPIQLSLPRNKDYTVWLEMFISDYRNATQGIDTIQKRLDTFENSQMALFHLYGWSLNFDRFFEIYASRGRHKRIIRTSGRLEAIRIPHFLRTDEGKKRICGVFVPSGLSANVLMPLAPKQKVYSYYKESYWREMKQFQVPDELISTSYQLLLHAGVSLVVFPLEQVERRRPEVMCVYFWLADPDDHFGPLAWRYHYIRAE
jgi:hypothetical protein